MSVTLDRIQEQFALRSKPNLTPDLNSSHLYLCVVMGFIRDPFIHTYVFNIYIYIYIDTSVGFKFTALKFRFG